MTSFKRLLPEWGYQKEPVEFYREVYRLFVIHFNRHSSDEQLKRHPTDALAFCNLVRNEMNLPLLPDEAILGALENHRKIGKQKMAEV
jgi:hypothetical protein